METSFSNEHDPKVLQAKTCSQEVVQEQEVKFQNYFEAKKMEELGK